MDYKGIGTQEKLAHLDFKAAQLLGDCHATVGNYQLAKDLYKAAASLAPDAPEPYVGLGVIALLDGRIDEAQNAFSVACRLDPSCSKAYAGLALIYQQKGRLQEAFEYYLKSLELDCDNLTALLGLFQASCQMGTFAQIIHYLEMYLQSHPADTSVMFCLAALYVKDGLTEKASQTLRQLLDLDPSNDEASKVLEEIDHTINQKAAALTS